MSFETGNTSIFFTDMLYTSFFFSVYTSLPEGIQTTKVLWMQYTLVYKLLWMQYFLHHASASASLMQMQNQMQDAVFFASKMQMQMQDAKNIASNKLNFKIKL